MELSVIPSPSTLSRGSGELRLPRGLWPSGDVPAEWLAMTRRRTAAWGLLDPDGAALELINEDLINDDAQAADSVRLAITDTGVRLSGVSRAGIAHGLGLIEQLLPPEAGGFAGTRPSADLTLPELELTSVPGFEHRGAMIDVSRHFFGSTVIAGLIRALGPHGYNRLHLHLSDDQGWRIESLRHPELVDVATHRPGTRFGPAGVWDPTPHGGYYTLTELRDLTELARDHGMELVAEIDLPGHSTALRAALPHLGRPGEVVEVLDTVGRGGSSVRPVPASLPLLTDLLDELVDATGITAVHLGGDECDLSWWMDDPTVAAHAATLGYDRPEQLHGWLLRELAIGLEARGVQVLVWDEAFSTGGLTDDTIVTAWHGHAVAERVAQTHRLVRAPLYPTYFNFDQSTDPDEPRAQGGPITVADVMAFDLAPADWSDTARANVLGGQFQVWSEWVTTEAELHHAVFPRALAMAEVLWNGPTDDPTELGQRVESAAGRLRDRGIVGRPNAGSLPWQRGGKGRRHRATGDDIEATKAWVESATDPA